MWMDWFHGVTFFEQTPFATNFLRALELKISPASCSRQIDCIEFQIRFTSQISQVLEDVVTICYNVVIALCCYTLNKELKPHKMHKIAPWSGSRRACDRSERMCALHAHHSPASRWKKKPSQTFAHEVDACKAERVRKASPLLWNCSTSGPFCPVTSSDTSDMSLLQLLRLGYRACPILPQLISFSDRTFCQTMS